MGKKWFKIEMETFWGHLLNWKGRCKLAIELLLVEHEWNLSLKDAERVVDCEDDEAFSEMDVAFSSCPVATELIQMAS